MFLTVMSMCVTYNYYFYILTFHKYSNALVSFFHVFFLHSALSSLKLSLTKHIIVRATVLVLIEVTCTPNQNMYI